MTCYPALKLTWHDALNNAVLLYEFVLWERKNKQQQQQTSTMRKVEELFRLSQIIHLKICSWL